MRRVVVTGMGIISSLGNNVAEVKRVFMKAAQAFQSNKSMRIVVCALMLQAQLKTLILKL